jgi:hypothetical protein
MHSLQNKKNKDQFYTRKSIEDRREDSVVITNVILITFLQPGRQLQRKNNCQTEDRGAEKVFFHALSRDLFDFYVASFHQKQLSFVASSGAGDGEREPQVTKTEKKTIEFGRSPPPKEYETIVLSLFL